MVLDAGVNFKEVQKALNFDFKNVLGVLITHEHKDHCKYVTNFALNGVNIYASAGTFEKLNLKGHRFRNIKKLKQFTVGNFTILPFDTQHDAAEPLGFLIQNKETQEKLLYATDTYYIKYKFNKLNYILLECNYIAEILKENIETGRVHKARYTRLLESHFSLENVIEFLKANDLSNTEKIILCHLSDQNSDEAIIQQKITELTHKDTIIARPDLVIELEKYLF